MLIREYVLRLLLEVDMGEKSLQIDFNEKCFSPSIGNFYLCHYLNRLFMKYWWSSICRKINFCNNHYIILWLYRFFIFEKSETLLLCVVITMISIKIHMVLKWNKIQFESIKSTILWFTRIICCKMHNKIYFRST